MRKIALLFVLSFAFLACETDNETLNNNQNLTFDSLSENNNIGKYKGVFTTLDSESRATVEITITDATTFVATLGNRATAKFTFEDGSIISAIATRSLELGEGIQDLEFTSNEMSFSFSVNDDGTNPKLSNVLYTNKQGAVVLKKHTNRAPVTPITGTYECVTCGDHPNLNAGDTQTFNVVVSDIEMDGLFDITTQVLLGSTEFLGDAIQDGDCTVAGSLTTCDTGGFFDVVDGTFISWDGTHIYNNQMSSPSDCSDFDGTWSWTTINYGVITGTYASTVTACVPTQQVIALEDFDGGLPSWSSTPSIAYFTNGSGDDFFGPSDGMTGGNSDDVNFANITGNFLFVQDLANGNGGTNVGDPATLTFDDVDVSTASGITVSFDYDVFGFDAGDDVFYTIVLDGVDQTPVQLVNGTSNFSVEGNLTEMIPDGTLTVGLIFSVKQNGAADYAGFDNFKIEGLR